MEASTFALTGARALEARERLLGAAASSARDDRRMAALGTAALFEEALLGALRAHLAELKAVAR